MLTPRQYQALQWAVRSAADWRGSLVGNPDTTDLEIFDREVKLAKQALKAVKPKQRKK